MKKFIVFFLFFTHYQLFCQTIKWVEIDNKINYSKTENQNGNAILMAFGGWTAHKNWVSVWTENLFKNVGNDLKIKYLFAVSGPKNSLYKDREINTKQLAEKTFEILKYQKNYKKNKLIVVAHSSGAYVAHEFFQFLFSMDSLNEFSNLKNRIIYFNLDGGTGVSDFEWTQIENLKIHLFKAIYGVYAFDEQSQISSPNKDEMLEIGKMDANCFSLEIAFENSECLNKWCVHETLIIEKPHNIHTFDLEKDYRLFSNDRKVCTKYFRVLKSKK